MSLMALERALLYRPLVGLSALGAQQDGTNDSTYTFSSVSFGDAHPARVIVVGVGFRSAGDVTITSVTIGGITANLIGEAANSAGGNTSRVALYKALVPTGTSGSVVMMISGTAGRAAMQAWRLLGTSNVSSSLQTSTGNSPSVNLLVPPGSVGLAFAMTNANSSATWTGLDENSDAVSESNSTFSAASRVLADGSASHAVQCTWGSNSDPAAVFAVMQAA